MCLRSFMTNNLTVILFTLSFFKISNTLVSDGVATTKIEFCKFTLNNNEIIDLSPLVESNQPLIVSTNTSLYIYHPCRDVPLNSVQDSECQKSYGLCYFAPKSPTNKPLHFNKVLNDTKGNFTLLARNAEGVFRDGLKKPEIVYKHSYNNTVFSSYIQLECDESIENYKLTIDKTSALEHVLTLHSKHACVSTTHYMSGGAVFFIILVVFITLYFVGGILVLKFIRGATGIEMIPNHEFWCNLPQSAKDGFKYLISCGKGSSDSYEKI